jgi:hypothetical protein
MLKICTDLCRLGMKHNTDKASSHKFTILYSLLFKKWRYRDDLNILEIGIRDGASIKMWKDWFENGNIFCVDIRENSTKNVIGLERVFGETLDSGNKNHWEKFFDKYQNVKFDIIIDDGSHDPDEQWEAFNFLKEYLKPGGFYIVEDLQVSWSFNNNEHKFINNITKMITNDLIKKPKKLLYEITFLHRVMVMRKNLYWLE